MKMLVQAHRKPGLTDEEFFPRWRGGHAALVETVADDIGFRRYVQSHRLEDATVASLLEREGWRESTSDGLAELWWESRDAMDAALASPNGSEASALLAADEQVFTDTKMLSAFLAREQIVYGDPPRRPRADGRRKLVIELRRDPGLSAEDFQHGWTSSGYANAVRARAPAIGLLAYVANLVDLDRPLDFAEQRGWRPAPDVVSELWWPEQVSIDAALANGLSDSAMRAAAAGLIDTGQASAYLAAEHPIFDHADPSAAV